MTIQRRISFIAGVLLSGAIAACGGGAPPAATPDETKPEGAAETTTATTPVAPKADPSLLPRQLIFGNPDRTAPRLSPDGKQLAWTAPKDGVLNVYVAPVGDLAKARPVTDEKNRPVPGFNWAYDNKHILYAIDKNGDENVHVFSVDVATSALKDLTPFEKTQGRIVGFGDKFPTSVVLATNDRDPKWHDAYRVYLVSGERKLLQKNESFAGF